MATLEPTTVAVAPDTAPPTGAMSGSGAPSGGETDASAQKPPAAAAGKRQRNTEAKSGPPPVVTNAQRRALKGEDAWKRMNYLYQSSHLVSLHGTTAGQNLSRFYAMNLKKIAAKLVMRLDPSVKNSMCKRCGTLLIPGHTSTIEVTSAGAAEASVLAEEATPREARTGAPAAQAKSAPSAPTPSSVTAASSAASTAVAPAAALGDSQDVSMSDVEVAASQPAADGGPPGVVGVHSRKRLRRHRSSGCNRVQPVRMIHVCATCQTRKRMRTQAPIDAEPTTNGETPPAAATPAD